MSLSLALLALAQAVPPPPEMNRYPDCAPQVLGPCIVPPPRLNLASLHRAMAGRQRIWWISGDVLTLVARPTEGWAMLCCGLQTPLEPIAGTDLAMISVRVPNIEAAIFDVNFMPGSQDRNPPVYRGPRAPAAPGRVAALAGAFETHVVQSAALGETREIHVYVPPGLGTARGVPVIYLADGGAAALIGVAEQLIVSGRIRPVIIVGINSARGSDARRLEYRHNGEPDAHGETRYAAHSRFVIDEVMPFVEAHYPVARDAARRMVAGYSEGGGWALSMAAFRPDLFGNLLAMSTGGVNRRLGGRIRQGKMYFGAGEYEPGFLAGTNGAAMGAREGGAEVRMRTIAAGHSMVAWEIFWAEALEWMFAAGDGS
jgi:enterochelin esterase-like enzyme